VQLKNKELSEAEKNKLAGLQNRAKSMDAEIEGLRTRLLLMQNVIREQAKGIDLHRPSDQSLVELRAEQEQLRGRIRAIKKHDQEQKDHIMALQRYQVELERLLRARLQEDTQLPPEHSESEVSEVEWGIVLEERRRAAARAEQESHKVQAVLNEIRRERDMDREALQKIKEREIELERLRRKLKEFSKITKSVDKSRYRKTSNR
jgi:hypothetical protein